MADINKYDHQDIRRYLDKQMTPMEMHAFERAMLDDPFLSDAMEGYEKSNVALASEHLLTIEQALRKEESRAKVVAMPVKQKYGWWRIAALILIIGGSAALLLPLFDKDIEQKDFASATSPVQNHPNDTIKSLEPVNRETQPVVEKSLLAAGKKPPVTLQQQPSQAPMAAQYDMKQDTFSLRQSTDQALAVTRNFAKSEKESAMAPRPEATSAMALNNATREFRGKVTDNYGMPVPMANIQTENNIATLTDKEGNFKIVAADSAVKVNVTSVGFAVAEKKLSDVTSNKIVLQRDEAALSEVVVVGYGAKKRSLLKSKQNKDSLVNGRQVAEAEPEGGWESFQEYAYRQLNRKPDTLEHAFNDDIMIEFRIDEKGKPKDILVLPPANKETAEKAVQILEKGPRWKRISKDRKAKVRIRI